MSTVNERILEAQIKHSIYIERYKGGVLRRIIGQLNKSEADLIETIAKRLATIEERGFDLGKESTKRLFKMLDEIVAERDEVYAELQKTLSDEMIEFSEYEADFQIRLAENAGVKASFTMPSNAQLKAIVTSQPFKGALLKDWAQGLGQNEVKRVHQAIRLGMTQGESLDQIVRRVRGTKKKQYQDGLLEIGRRHAEAVVRTAVAHVQSRAKAEVYQANADIVKQYQHISTLDGKTSPECIKNDKKIYPDYKSVKWTPLHFSCRSIIIAYFKDDERGTRASKFGPVPEETDYDSFLRKQSKEFQEEVLGVERARLYRAGKEPVGNFIDRSGKFYTLKELKQRET